MTRTDCIETHEIRRDRNARLLAYNALNNAGQGFDPSDDLGGWRLLHEARTTDDVSVYEEIDTDGDVWLVLVGTDGTGSDDSRWAVRVGETGVEIDNDGSIARRARG